MFAQGIKKGSRILAPGVGILLGIEYARCDECDDGTSNEGPNDDWFQGQCLKRQLFQPKIPYPLWNYDWDGRMVPETTLEAQAKGVKVRGKTRHVVLIRHGQYDENHKEDDKRKLTELGRMQADLTGRRLAIMAKGLEDKFGPCNITAIRSSGMTRAKETAEIIAKHLPDIEMAKSDPMLNEALAAPIIPIRPEIDATEEIDQNSERIEAAFQKYIYRANPSFDDNEHEFEVIVCHGNVIRYFFCRALQIPPEAWLRMSIFNCSLTYIMVKPNGHCTCRMLGDIGHLGYEHTTFSNGYGFAWS